MAHIIYAEDDKLMAQVVRNILHSEGHVVGLVEDGKSALNAISVKRPQLVLLDCTIPELSGIEVLREIRMNQTLCELPVMMLTARDSMKDMNLAAYAGADGYLKKPFDPEYLIYLTGSLIQRGRAARHMAH